MSVDFKSLVKGVFKKNGAYISKTTQKDKIRNFLVNLRPINCGVNLIRVGSDNDGGYLLPDDLDGVEYCFSPGVSDNCSFELDLQKYAIKSFLSDYSVDDVPTVEKGLVFDKKFIAAADSDFEQSLDSWFSSKLGESKSEAILQMDIEGAEYSSLLSMSLDTQKKFRIIIVEFHSLQDLTHPFSFRIIDECFKKLLGTHQVVHAHSNNCCGSFRFAGGEIPNIIEMTFLRKDRCLKAEHKQLIENPLDQKNIPNKEDVSLPSVWFES